MVLAGLTGAGIVALLAATGELDDGSGTRIDAVGDTTTTTSATTGSASGDSSATEAAAASDPTDPASTATSTTASTATSEDAASTTTETSEPPEAAVSEPNRTVGQAARVARFRELATENELGTDPLTDQDIQDFAEALCVIAGIEDTTGFSSARSQIAADQALASALTAEQLSSTINAAVRAFCPSDALRLGL